MPGWVAACFGREREKVLRIRWAKGLIIVINVRDQELGTTFTLIFISSSLTLSVRLFSFFYRILFIDHRKRIVYIHAHDHAPLNLVYCRSHSPLPDIIGLKHLKHLQRATETPRHRSPNIGQSTSHCRITDSCAIQGGFHQRRYIVNQEEIK